MLLGTAVRRTGSGRTAAAIGRRADVQDLLGLGSGDEDKSEMSRTGGPILFLLAPEIAEEGG